MGSGQVAVTMHYNWIWKKFASLYCTADLNFLADQYIGYWLWRTMGAGAKIGPSAVARAASPKIPAVLPDGRLGLAILAHTSPRPAVSDEQSARRSSRVSRKAKALPPVDAKTRFRGRSPAREKSASRRRERERENTGDRVSGPRSGSVQLNQDRSNSGTSTEAQLSPSFPLQQSLAVSHWTGFGWVPLEFLQRIAVRYLFMRYPDVVNRLQDALGRISGDVRDITVLAASTSGSTPDAASMMLTQSLFLRVLEVVLAKTRRVRIAETEATFEFTLVFLEVLRRAWLEEVLPKVADEIPDRSLCSLKEIKEAEDEEMLKNSADTPNDIGLAPTALQRKKVREVRRRLQKRDAEIGLDSLKRYLDTQNRLPDVLIEAVEYIMDMKFEEDREDETNTLAADSRAHDYKGYDVAFIREIFLERLQIVGTYGEEYLFARIEELRLRTKIGDNKPETTPEYELLHAAGGRGAFALGALTGGKKGGGLFGGGG
ncbi:unnamed protein product, partial [Amoebophrya sp. A25]|eukprot:GSA25T00000243001.1